MEESNTNQLSKYEPNSRDFIISYLLLRQWIGILGILLPFLLAIFNFLIGGEYWFQISISHYYYSYVHILFVGILCLIGGFLISYRGAKRSDNRSSTLAGLFAIGVATFPTCWDGFRGNKYIYVTYWENWVGLVHYGCATLMFLSFVYFCLVSFQEKDNGSAITADDTMKLRRNFIYKCCGIGILVSIGVIGGIEVYKLLGFKGYITPFTTIIFETTSLWCFGFSWLLKGSQNWKDSRHGVLRVLVKNLR